MMAVEIIAEISSNHGGDLVLAKEFIHACAEHGADWVKFQTTRVKHLNPADPQYAWFAQAELSDDAHYELKAECERAGVKFLTTVFHADEVPLIVALGLDTIKIGSGEANERGLADAVKATAIPRVLVSMGIHTDTQKLAFAWFTSPVSQNYGWSWQRDPRVEFLRCQSRYPTPTLYAAGGYDRPVVGWSDHCRGIEGCQIAIMNGATVIEKHVRLDHQARGVKPYEATMAELQALRQFADDDPQRFLGRWQYA